MYEDEHLVTTHYYVGFLKNAHDMLLSHDTWNSWYFYTLHTKLSDHTAEYKMTITTSTLTDYTVTRSIEHPLKHKSQKT